MTVRQLVAPGVEAVTPLDPAIQTQVPVNFTVAVVMFPVSEESSIESCWRSAWNIVDALFGRIDLSLKNELLRFQSTYVSIRAEAASRNSAAIMCEWLAHKVSPILNDIERALPAEDSVGHLRFCERRSELLMHWRAVHQSIAAFKEYAETYFYARLTALATTLVLSVPSIYFGAKEESWPWRFLLGFGLLMAVCGLGGAAIYGHREWSDYKLYRNCTHPDELFPVVSEAVTAQPFAGVLSMAAAPVASMTTPLLP